MSSPPALLTGRNTPTRPTRRVSRSRSPRATVDLPVSPSADAMYTLRDMIRRLSVRVAQRRTQA